MIAYGLLVTVVAWMAIWCLGDVTARLLFGPRSALVTAATRLPLGLSATLCLLEGAGYFLPIRIAAWLVVLPASYGALSIARRWRRAIRSRERAIVASSLGGLVAGLVPVAVAGRFTSAALTNNDGTYYLTAADRLARVAWRDEYPSWDAVPPSQCLIEQVLHLWQWRTGTPNLMAAVSSLSGLGSTQALAVVTAILFACVPCAAIGIGRALGVPRGGVRELSIGLVPVFAAAPAFLGYQHMTGHLGVQSLFPAACGALVTGVRSGGWRRALYAALLLGASVALFADGASVLLVIAAAALVAGRHHLTRSLRWILAVAAATCFVAPFTIDRATRAAWNTMLYRVPSPRTVFPQRGWLPRRVLDDLATLTNVDPWPPWPAAWPPHAETVVTWLGALCGTVLLGYGASRLRARRGERVAAAMVGGAVLLGVAIIRIHYLQGKVLLTGAAFIAPLCGVGAATLLSKRWGRWLVLPFVFAELHALGQLARPTHWKVVDHREHDRLVPELARLPPGSLLAFDGLGAPADIVLDEHRAHRAALLAGLGVVQPGLDGGFYIPLCTDVERPDPLPSRAYALQRTTSETLTQGTTLSTWGSFRLLAVDLTRPESFVAAWAPTHGWIAAEHDPDGRVFRWAEWQSQGTLHAIAQAPCARLRGEMRVVRGTGIVGVRLADVPIFTGSAGPEWSSFETPPFSILDPAVVSFGIIQTTAAPPDAAHALAVSRLALEPAWQCGGLRPADGKDDGAEQPIELVDAVELAVSPPIGAACYSISMHVTGERGASIRLTFDGEPPALRYVDSPTELMETEVVESTRARRLIVARSGGTPGVPFHLTDVAVTPRTCPR